MKQILIIFILIFSLKCFSQENPEYLLWSSDYKITVDDFGIKKSDSQSGSSFALFTIEHSVSGLELAIIRTIWVKSFTAFLEKAGQLRSGTHVYNAR